ncbi:hypothetical protein FQN54_001972 [Arachnomyces sp. PD_36]|nr:hypothetical protein FQN54_001972 [Arachnomyces sp. PD_36]
MGKKRKAGRGLGQKAEDRGDEFEKSKFAADEQFLDSEDEFQAGRDRVLLDERPEAKRRRKLEEQEEFFQESDEEVLGYDAESAEDDDIYDMDDEEDDMGESDTEQKDAKKSKRLRRNGLSPVLSDEEVEVEEDEEEGGWGSSKKDYYNADVLETEADALDEEKEAKKIQQKRLQSMTAADFGFDEAGWLEGGEDQQEDSAAGKGIVTEVLPQLEITDDMGEAEKRKLMKSRYPEFEYLRKDFMGLQTLHEELRVEASVAELAEAGSDSDDEPTAPVAVIKFQALSAYLGSICMYFSLLASPARDKKKGALALPAAELREHPIMNALVRCRKLWEQVKDLETPQTYETSEDESMGAEDLAEMEPEPVREKKPSSKRPKKPKKTKAQRDAAAAQAEAEARRAEIMRQTEEGLADLDGLVSSKPTKTTKSKSKPATSHKDHEDSDFGDEDALTAHEAAQKAEKKKSLRFYTSQIAQKANKRGAAGRDAGGDADLPYRERLKDRQARLNAQAEKRGKRDSDKPDFLGEESDEDDRRVAGEVRGDNQGTDDDDYYDMVAARNKQRKSEKKQLAEAHAEAARQGGRVEVQEEIGPDGKRAITYAIEKNKGLTPKRSKDVRNPRVKKRKKFEEKKKKLGSMRPIYKGGEGRGGYAGELTGIKKNLVKSVKL